jgi:hypothetical protein
MNYVEQLKQQIALVSNDRNKYVTKYQKYKQLYTSSITSAQNQYVNYVFSMENYLTSLKMFECEMSTIEFFYDIYFSPFSIDSWFKRNNTILIKRTLSEIFEPFNYVNVTVLKEKSYSLEYLQYLRNLVMFHLKQGHTISIYSVHLDEPYIVTITKDVFQVINKYHNESCLCIGNTHKIEIFNMNKHYLLQFIVNPFWETSLYIPSTIDTNKIIKKNSDIINIPYNFSIDSRNPEWEDDFIDDFVNPYFDNDQIDFDAYNQIIIDLILDYDLDSEITHTLWNLLMEMREKLRSSDKIQFLNNANEFTTTCIKKQVIWMNTTSPYIDYEKLYELASGSKNLFSNDEISLVESRKIVHMSPSDLYLILPSIFENNHKLLDVMSCYLTKKSDIPQDPVRRDIIVNQFKKMSKENVEYLSAYGVDFLFHLLTRDSESNDYTILSSFIWDERLWQLNYIMTKISYINFFDIINKDSKITWKDMSFLLGLNSSIESKIAVIIYAHRTGYLFPDLVVYWDNNPKQMLQIIKYKEVELLPLHNRKRLPNKDFKTQQKESLDKEISSTNVYGCYLFKIQEFNKLNLEKKTFLSFKNENHIVEFQHLIRHLMYAIKTLKNIEHFYDDSFSYLKIEFEKEDIFNLLMIRGKLLTPLRINYSISLNSHYLEYKMGKFYYTSSTSNNNFIFIQSDKLPPCLVDYELSCGGN